MTTAYLAAEGYEPQLAAELAGRVRRVHGRLFVCDGDGVDAAWAVNTWFDVEELVVASVGDAARRLRERQRSWAPYAPEHRGRIGLIVDKLPPLSRRELQLGEPAPASPLGSFTLLAPDRMLAAARCSSTFPNGEPPMAEMRVGPPNRAYRKLWEAFLVLGRYPQAGDVAVDLGASPGGWSWALAELGCSVVAVDKAALAPAVASRVLFVEGSAFAVDPDRFEDVAWVCSDIACYPDRLFGLADRWRSAHPRATLVFTVKFQGSTDHAVAGRLRELPGARLVHLHHNKHELTMLAEG